MRSWRDAILKEFTPQVARLTVASDPDGLLLEERILKEVAQRGFELLPFDDPVAFRFAYESRYRSRWDRGQHTALVVVLGTGVSDIRALPHDLLQAGRQVSFTLGELFPDLSYPVIDTLERSDLDILYQAQTREAPSGPLGETQTLGFVLRHVFGIAPETIRQESDLFQFLLRRHYRGLRIPPVLDDHLLRLLRQNPMFEAWPLHEIFSDREAFFAFLQERWPSFLDRQTSDDPSVREQSAPAATQSLRFPGPMAIPFEHLDVRVYVDNLFLEGFLQPVTHPDAYRLAGSWEIAGIKTDPDTDLQRRLEGLLTVVEQSAPASDARHQDWLTFARRWAHVNALVFSRNGGSVREDTLSRYRTVRDRIDLAFTAWIEERFGTLHNQPPLPAVMTHHVPRMLARTLEESQDAKVALVLMDGLSLDQWATVRGVLADQRPNLRFREDTLFAWIPTLTMVSRQACFSGRPPLYFPASIHTTDREPTAWRRFWVDEGLPAAAVGYAKNLRDHQHLDHVAELVSYPKMRALGLVVDAVDQIMHGMTLGQPGMHVQVRQWTSHGFLAALIELLMDNGFTVFLSSDHGNIETRGCGRPAEGSAADLRGERVRVFPDPALRAQVKQRFPDAIEWPTVGLPDDYHALIAPSRASFVRPSERPVAHGGITLEEVVVPLVRIESVRSDHQMDLFANAEKPLCDQHELPTASENPANAWERDAAKRSLDELFSLTHQYRNSKDYHALIKFVARFRSYSPYNAMLLHVQMPGARFVAPPNRWLRDYGRAIKPGARPIVILQPMGPVMFVFDVNHTEPMEDAPALPPEVEKPFEVTGARVGAGLSRVIENGKRDGVRVIWSEQGSQSAGSIAIRQVDKSVRVSQAVRAGIDSNRDPIMVDIPVKYDLVVNRKLNPESKYATIAHELAHLYCGHLVLRIIIGGQAE